MKFVAIEATDIKVGQVVYCKFGDDTASPRVITDVKVNAKGETYISIFKKRARSGSNFYGEQIFNCLVKEV